MLRGNNKRLTLLVGTVALIAVSGSRVEHPRVVREKVTLMGTPDGGIQPQVAVDRKGFLHLIYFKGDPGAGDTSPTAPLMSAACTI
jgi:hypothetical protein